MNSIQLNQVQPGQKYRVQVAPLRYFTAPPEGENSIYCIAQGCATDGKHGYFILVSDTDGKGTVIKVDLSTFNVVNVKHGLPVEHGNDAAYNCKKQQLVVVNNAPHYDTLTILNPDTLEVVEQVKLSFNAYAIAYVPAVDQYVIGISGSYDFMITDSDFHPIRRVTGVDTGIIKQGMDADEKYVYFPQWDHNNRANCIVVYDWNGNMVNTLPVESTAEIESMFTVEGTTYIAFHKQGCVACRATIIAE